MFRLTTCVVFLVALVDFGASKGCSAKAGTITLTPANVSAILSATSSGIDIVKDGANSKAIVGARKIVAGVFHPRHPRAAIQKVEEQSVAAKAAKATKAKP